MDLRVSTLRSPDYLYPETDPDQTKRNLRASRDSLRRHSRDLSHNEADNSERELKPERKATGVSADRDPLETPEVPRKPQSPKPVASSSNQNPKPLQPIARDLPDEKGRALKKAGSSQLEPSKPIRESTQLGDSRRQLFIVEGFNMMDESHIGTLS
jgi:hypothetical protein